jgi:Outer membrane protein beta-barrel domain
MRRVFSFGLTSCVALAAAIVTLLPADASAQQSVSFYVGGFVPRSVDARDPNDVLVNDQTFLTFDVSNLNGFTFGGEYLAGLGDKFEAGVGLGYYQSSTAAADRFSEFADTGAPIVATLKLRTVPFTATVRWLPLGHSGIQPYIGGGVGVIAWRYSESGDFVASDGVSIVNGTFVGSGTATGPVILGGVRVPAGPWAIGGEIRYQSALGDLPPDQQFAGSKIDLGGFTYAFTFNVKF